jgi:hypothetical protein
VLGVYGPIIYPVSAQENIYVPLVDKASTIYIVRATLFIYLLGLEIRTSDVVRISF